MRNSIVNSKNNAVALHLHTQAEKYQTILTTKAIDRKFSMRMSSTNILVLKIRTSSRGRDIQTTFPTNRRPQRIRQKQRNISTHLHL